MDNLSVKIKEHLRNISNFPKENVQFKDVTTLLNDKIIFNEIIDYLEHRYRNYSIDFIVGIEARGFIFAAALAARLRLAFVPIRKPGKLPSKVLSRTYDLEYASGSLEIHEDAFLNIPRPKVLLIDDLLATGGTAICSLELIAELGGECIEFCSILALEEFEKSKSIATLKNKSRIFVITKV